MLNVLDRNRKITLCSIDSIAITSSFFLSFLLRFDFKIPESFLSELIFLLPVYIIIHLFIFNLSGYYDVIWRFTSLWDMLNIVRAITYSSSISFFILSITKGASGYPRSVLIIFFVINILFIGLSRIFVRLYHSHYKKTFRKIIKTEKRLILVGAGNTGEKITREIINGNNSPYELVGFVDDDLSIQGSTIHGKKIIGLVSDLPKLEERYDEILITAPSSTGDQMRRIVQICENTGKKFLTVPSLVELMNKDLSIKLIRNVSYVDLLGRKEINLDINSIDNIIFMKRILITGAGGSIGSELVRQCLKFKPSEIICLDHSEEKIFNLEQEIGQKINQTILKYNLCTINNRKELDKPFADNRPQIVIHAAAYKHVPIQEHHPWSAVKTNVGGTNNLVYLSDRHKVELFILVSTDKAVNPVNVMGATKRAAEKIIQSYNEVSETSFMAVRFGNVLGSSGSAIPIFEKQIKKGGPLTITHPDMTRYFMSIQEASQLILQCAAIGKGGQIFLLEMGTPIKILQMAKDLIRLSGFEPDKDIPIVFTGLRPGEKLYEELQLKDERKVYTRHNKIMILKGKSRIEPWQSFETKINLLINAAKNLEPEKIEKYLKAILPTYEPRQIINKTSEEVENIKAMA